MDDAHLRTNHRSDASGAWFAFSSSGNGTIVNNGLDTTYQTLATSKNEAVVVVLDVALRSGNAWVRQRAIEAVIARRSIPAGRRLIEQWENLTPEERQKLDRESDWLIDAMLDDLRGDREAMRRAIQIAHQLRIDRLAVPLISLAEAHPDPTIRQEAMAALLAILTPLGIAARQEETSPSVRGTILSQLEQTLQRYDNHGNAELVDAFLIASSWSDRQLRAIASDDSEVARIVQDRLGQSENPQVVALLAAAVTQRRCPLPIRRLISRREGNDFRLALLDAIDGELQPSVRANLNTIGMPASCLGGMPLLHDLNPLRRVSLALLYAVTDNDDFRVLEMLITALGEAPQRVKGKLLHELAEVPPLDVDRLLRAAVVVAREEAEEHPALQPNAALLMRLLQLLEREDAAMERVIQRVLAPLQADNVLEQMGCFRMRTQRKIGRVVMQTDPAAVERVQERMRHPVLQRRMQAIEAAQAFEIVDRLSPWLIKIAQDDHQEARLAAIEALGQSRLPECRKALEEVVAGPDGSIRDAAWAALQGWQGDADDI